MKIPQLAAGNLTVKQSFRCLEEASAKRMKLERIKLCFPILHDDYCI